MADGFLAWSKRQMQQWARVIPLLENGTIQMMEVRDGERINITDEHLAFIRQRMSELNELIAKHDPASSG